MIEAQSAEDIDVQLPAHTVEKEQQLAQEISQSMLKDLRMQLEEKDRLCKQLQETMEESQARMRDDLANHPEEKDRLSQQLQEEQETSQSLLKDLRKQVEEKYRLSQQLKEEQGTSQSLLKDLRKQVEEKNMLSQKLQEEQETSQSILKDLRKQVEEKDKQMQEAAEEHTCQICMDYHADRALLCGHAFCQHCMSKLEEQELGQPQGSIKKMGCPVCRQSLASLAPELQKMLKQTTRKRGRNQIDDVHSSVSYPLKIFKS